MPNLSNVSLVRSISGKSVSVMLLFGYDGENNFKFDVVIYCDIVQLLQAPYNVVTYTLIGDDQAPNFFAIDKTTGQISVKRSLNDDSSVVYKVSYNLCQLSIVQVIGSVTHASWYPGTVRVIHSVWHEVC